LRPRSARIYRPGTKFDSVLVFDGAQGIGKSTLFKDLVGDEYYSETLSLTDMDDKSGAEKLQGFWVVEIGELAGMKKADIEKVKAFLSPRTTSTGQATARPLRAIPANASSSLRSTASEDTCATSRATAVSGS
jgi:predicted P-loop ATPase